MVHVVKTGVIVFLLRYLHFCYNADGSQILVLSLNYFGFVICKMGITVFHNITGSFSAPGSVLSLSIC